MWSMHSSENLNPTRSAPKDPSRDQITEAKQNKKSRGPLLDHLDEIEARCLNGDPTLRDIFDVFGPEGHYVLILFMVLPFLQPIPLFGLSTVFGTLIAIVAAFAYAKRPPWLPQKWISKKISSNAVSKIAESSERIFEKLAFLIHPRWKFFFKGFFRPLNTVLLILNAILLALPLPIPFSNAIPGWMIFFQALAHLEEDGFLIVVSYVQAVLCFVYFVFIAKGIGTGIEAFGF